MKIELKSLTRDELAREFAKRGEPSFRADQVLSWAYAKSIESFGRMKNLPAALRSALEGEFDLTSVKSLRDQHSTDTTEKFLFVLRDGALVETVLIPATPGRCSQSDRRTVCVSTQVGCAYGCKFCASGLNGFRRNLTAGEIVDQVVAVQRLLRKPENLSKSKMNGKSISASGTASFRVNNIVVMGMGEPLANYDNLMRALRILHAPWGLGIGAHKITVSTVGLVPGIQQLADDPLPIRIAISLHGPTDEVRDRTMPVNRKWPLKELLAACEYYAKTKRRILTFEYILIDGVNDALELVEPLAQIARRVHAKVNLIPYNAVKGLPWHRPSEDHCVAFAKKLKSLGVQTTLRHEKGHDIAAACGQLRLQGEKAV